MQGRDWIYDTEDHFWVDHCSLDGGGALRRYSLGSAVFPHSYGPVGLILSVGFLEIRKNLPDARLPPFV
jgi:hypothetical protein